MRLPFSQEQESKIKCASPMAGWGLAARALARKLDSVHILERMSISAEKVAEMLALPQEDRAFLAHQLIASLDNAVNPDAEIEWYDVIDRRSREMAEDQVDVRTEEEVLRDIRAKLHAARHQAS